MTPVSITLAYEGLGIFLIDSYMNVEFICGETSEVWKSHISKYNQSEYLVLYQQFCLYIQSQGFEGAPSFEEFKKILETVFQAYCLLR